MVRVCAFFCFLLLFFVCVCVFFSLFFFCFCFFFFFFFFFFFAHCVYVRACYELRWLYSLVVALPDSHVTKCMHSIPTNYLSAMNQKEQFL